MNAIIQFSLLQRVFVIAMCMIVVLFGVNAWLNLPVDAFPDISPTQVKVIYKVPGMTAEEIEVQVTQPIETELLGIPNQTVLRSTTKYAITSITLDFEDGTDIYWARQQVNSRLTQLSSSFPAQIEGGVAAMSTPLSELFMFTIEHPDLSLQEKKHILDWKIRPALRTIQGVADVNVLGGYTATYQFNPDLQKLAAYGLTLDSLQEAIRANNQNGSLGRIDLGSDAIIVRANGKSTSFSELQTLPIKLFQGQLIRLADLGTLSVGSLARYGGVTKDGEEAVQALVVALKDTNTGQLLNAVTEKLAELKTTLPAGTELKVFYNRKELIDKAVYTITKALTEAIIIVVLVLAFYLGNVRASLTVALVIPITVFITFLVMEYTNITANLMSLGGLVIAIGMLVDASVVVVENIVTELNKGTHLPRLHLIYRACKAVAKPVLAGTIIVMIVFTPLFTLTGLEGKLFAPVAKTIVYAMLISLVCAFTIIPVVASFLVSSTPHQEPKYITQLRAKYEITLQAALASPKVVISGALVLLIVSSGLFTQVGKTFMPTLDEGDIILQLEKQPSISLESSLALDKQIESHLLAAIPEIKLVVARTGSDQLGLDPMGLNQTDMFLQLNAKDSWRFDSKAELINAIRAQLHFFPGINFNFTQPIQMRVSEMLTGTTGMVAIKIFGDDFKTLASLSKEILAIVEQTDGAIDSTSVIFEGGDYLNIKIKPEIALGFNMTVETLSNWVKSHIDGIEVGSVIKGKVTTPIVIASLADGLPTIYTQQGLESLYIPLPDGSTIELKEIADISLDSGPLIINRETANRFAIVTSNVDNRDLVSFVEEIKTKIEQNMTIPSGYALEFGGEFENQARATKNLLMIIPGVLVVIVLILFSLFRSLKLSALILANIPFAMIGGIIALYISGLYLSVPASVGFIALLGVAVLNGVVMVSHFQTLESSNSAILNVIVSGAADRLRPILMTATTAMLGLVPLAFSSGPGAEIQKPLAIVVIGGLISSTLITLYLLPLGYKLLRSRP